MNFMKVRSLVLILSILGLEGCFLVHDSKSPTLPPATQTGANTLGFLLNGQLWLPDGACGYSNQSPVYDPDFNGKPEFDMTCFKCTTSQRMTFAFYLRGINHTGVYPVSPDSLGSCGFASDNCQYLYHDTTVYRKGNITITNFSLPIISGTFEMVMYKKGCDSLKITQGRFDIKL